MYKDYRVIFILMFAITGMWRKFVSYRFIRYRREQYLLS